MPLMPKRVKFRKVHRGRINGLALKGNRITFGTYALQSLSPAWITNQQIESARVAINRHVRRGGEVWIRCFPDRPYTELPAERRRGQ